MTMATASTSGTTAPPGIDLAGPAWGTA
ncbi:MAG: hypothetical protein QOI80_146, partial [Solirubrobacteraceae bacterium]|nr:hypothetical protein [Solirubrobacteraceae bacterium]